MSIVEGNRMRTLRVVGTGFACAMGLLGASSPAWAGTVGAADGTASFVATGSEINELTVSLDGGFYVFRDTATPVAATAGCEAVDANTARCAAAGPPAIAQIAIQAGPGNDAVTNATATRSRILGGPGDDILTGGSEADVIDGEGDVDLIDAGAGDDRLVDQINQDGLDNPDRYRCGAGLDAVNADVADLVEADCETVSRPVTAPGPGGGDPVIVPGPAGPDTGPQQGPCGRVVLGTGGADRLRGGRARDQMFGLRGNDVAFGRGSADCLFGGDGNDRLDGQDGNDALSGGQGADDLRGGAGRDRLAGGAGNDRLRGDQGNDRLSGGAGRDTLLAGGGRNVLLAGAGADVVSAVNGRRDTISCGGGNDRVRADAIDRLRGCERVSRAR
jgi:Ca2+-binding RTX toxin-like protein